MTILTPELIEKAAEALFLNSGWRDWGKEHPESQDLWMARARVAIAAVLPNVVEEAAKVAEGHDPNALVYRWVLARDIRSLLNKEDKANG